MHWGISGLLLSFMGEQQQRRQGRHPGRGPGAAEAGVRSADRAAALLDPLLIGLVFMAFGFNWVDCGGLLGGRLDEDIVRVPTTISRRNLASVARSATASML